MQGNMKEMRRGKLPDVGTSVFTVMSRRAGELGALNLGQGFPDYEVDPRLGDLVAAAMRAGHNQYAPMEGLISLRERIAEKLGATYVVTVDPESQITVTVGATEAIYSSIQALAGPGDEVIMFDPAYDCYEPAVRLAGARSIRAPLRPPAFAYDWGCFRGLLNERTRLVLLNNPHNPTCTTATATDLDELAQAIRCHDVTVIADEVYEHVVCDGRRHASVLEHEELAERSIAVFSFGKSLHATGLRVGYAVARAELSRELRKVHQFNTFSIAHPLQQAIATYLLERPDFWRMLTPFFESKRERFRRALGSCGFVLQPAQGTYFQLLDFGRIAPPGDVRFAERLLTEAGVATIPLSPFYEDPPSLTLVRVCIAKLDTTLDAAAARLRSFADRLQTHGDEAPISTICAPSLGLL